MQRVLCHGFLCALGAGAFASTAAAQEFTGQAAAASERVVVTGMIPPPDVGEGAPYHSTEEIRAIAQAAGRDASEATGNGREAGRSDACRDSVPDMMTPGRTGRSPLDRTPMNIPRLQGLYRDERGEAQKVSRLAAAALEATVAAEDSRRAAALGANNKSVVEKTELARQKAVNALEKSRLKLMEIQASIADYGHLRLRNGGEPIHWIDLDSQALQRKRAGWGLGVPKRRKTDLTVVNTTAAEYLDDDGYYLKLTGVIVNSGERPLDIPDFVVSVLDKKGFALRNVLAAIVTSVELPPGGAQPFSYDVRPSPQNVGRVVINFTSGFEPPPELPVSLVCEADPPSIP